MLREILFLGIAFGARWPVSWPMSRDGNWNGEQGSRYRITRPSAGGGALCASVGMERAGRARSVDRSPNPRLHSHNAPTRVY